MGSYYIEEINDIVNKASNITDEDFLSKVHFESVKLFGVNVFIDGFKLDDKLFNENPKFKENAIDFIYFMKYAYAVYNSEFDVNKLAYALQISTCNGMIGGASMTNFECTWCGEVEMFGSTNVPKICTKCANKQAVTIIQHSFNIKK